ncbi:SPOR domain-containing protein [Apibacter adventoris]|uniref:SPOR domain-containing protein n=1 Tax=Apibacter adventoris TaxID=1679466 RepID=A0A2S8AEV6_9FLAO|nr:SPOR domain-containing protein [Apibacter adventoris]PQL94168.1 hypothetical protein C4S77_03120 [Apibacter adventoris]
MKNYLLTLLLLFTCSSFFMAQEVIIKVDSATGSRLIIKGEPLIIKMLNDKEICNKSTKTSSTSSSTPIVKTKPKNNSPKSVCGRRNDIPGFMIKVAEAKSEQDINSLLNNFRSEFPELRVEKHYLRPDWRLLAGDYFKKESAQIDLRRIRRNFPSAVVINWRIYCNRAK